MRVYCFRCYWPSNLVFVVRCVTYISKFEEDRIKNCDHYHVFRTDGEADRQTCMQTDIRYLSDFYRASVCLSRVLCAKTKQCTKDILIADEKAINLDFYTDSGWWATPPLV